MQLWYLGLTSVERPAGREAAPGSGTGAVRSVLRKEFSEGRGGKMRVHVIEPQLQYVKMANMSIALQLNPWVLGAWLGGIQNGGDPTFILEPDFF